MRAFSQQTTGVVAIDGKTLRRSFDTASEKSALHMVSCLRRRKISLRTFT